MKKLITFFGIALLIASCGHKVVTPLENLISKRDSIKLELADINKEIIKLDTAKKEIVLLVTSSIVEQKAFSHKIEIQGQVETDQNIMINAEASGVIKTVSVREGQRVSRGQTLVIIDSELISTSIAELNNSLDLATFMYNKQKSLNEKGLGTEIELEQAKNQKVALESKLISLKAQKGKTVVKAPFSGVVDQIFTHNGEMASPAAPLIRLVNNSNMKVSASVSENLLGNVQIGTPVELAFPSLNDLVITSSVSYIGNYIDEVNRTFRIQIKVDGKNGKKLLPNQLTKVNITDLQLDSALVVDKNTILQDTENNNFLYVLTKAEGELYSVEKVYVTIIASYRGYSAIEPSEEGKIVNNSMIVLGGGKGITASDKVKIK